MKLLIDKIILQFHFYMEMTSIYMVQSTILHAFYTIATVFIAILTPYSALYILVILYVYICSIITARPIMQLLKSRMQNPDDRFHTQIPADSIVLQSHHMAAESLNHESCFHFHSCSFHKFMGFLTWVHCLRFHFQVPLP